MAGKFFRAFRAALPMMVRDCAGLAGAALVSYGASLVYYPAGLIVGGVLLLAGAVMAARSESE